MADAIQLKALVDKEKNRVIFAEADDDLVDILFSFLTIPIGTIIRLARNKSVVGMVGMGCMNNLYTSAENIDDKFFKSRAFKLMLLTPRYYAQSHCKNLKLKMDNETPKYCGCSLECITSKYKLLSHYRGALCKCGEEMDCGISEKRSKPSSFTSKDGGVFVKLGMTKFIVSDDLQVMPMSTAASLSLFSKLGIKDCSGIEERIFNVKVDEVLNLLISSLVSSTPLTETLLKHKPVPELNIGNLFLRKPIEYQAENKKNSEGKITVKLMVSKSKKKVCYAEAKKDFVNLLFSFLTVPLGHIAKQNCKGSLSGCIVDLYKSVHDLDEQYLKSNYHKEMLVSPKLASNMSYKNDLLGIEEASDPSYYFYTIDFDVFCLATDRSLIPSRYASSATSLTVLGPKFQYNDGENDEGFITGQAMFTVTDSLIIRPISPILVLSILNELKVPFNDIEEQIVHVGKDEALRLLQTCFVSESALTNAFIRDQKQRTENTGYIIYPKK
ncbi:hypothetical protein FNV43_RR05053 [Rhamnella rubrinervis]|uniref:DUF674 family protein n=1 Tax=Rhamnella rubrinervis TaxID=2594499 RepID=A0A8K0HMZ8_9ROSA|nr:hypothetical protein FNV43_RR05053 [Rhamnella rubrinervis]